MIDDLKYFDGELKDIDRVPEDIKQRYLTAFGIDPKWVVDAAARRQKWMDQSQSVNLWLATPDMKNMSHMYRHAWRAGVRTTYYLRSLGASSIEKASVGAKKEVRGVVGDAGRAAAAGSTQVSALSPRRRPTPPPKKPLAASKRCATASNAKPASKHNLVDPYIGHIRGRAPSLYPRRGF